MIWLVDYTTYHIAIDATLAQYKRDYFRVKQYKRKRMIGETAPPRTMTYSNGLLRLATLLAGNGVACRYLHSFELEKVMWTEPLPEIVAFSTVCSTVPRAATLAKHIKLISPKTKVYVGGPQINLSPKMVKERFPIFDKLTVGYELDAAGEIAGKPIADIRPYIDFSLLPHPLASYAINTFTALGCPFGCNYCADGRAPKICVSDDAMLSQMSSLPPKTLIHVFDSVFGYSGARAIAICKNLQQLQHPFVLSCDMRAEMITEELVREMQKAGFREIRLGIESADAELLQKNGRTLAPQRCLDTVKIIRENSDIYVTLYSVTGLPGTTKESFKRTLGLFEELLSTGRVDEIKNALFVPYPYDDDLTRGVRILDDDWAHYDRQSYPVYDTPELSREEIWQMYLTVTKATADSWLKGIGFSRFEDVPQDGNYREYVQDNYFLEEETDE